jgi:nucleoid-associated protein YgaU
MAQNGKLEKATLKVVAGTAKKKELKFCLNPTDLSISRKAKWSPGKPTVAGKAARDQFQGVDPLDLKLSVLIDAREADKEDVIGDVETLFAWLSPGRVGDKEPPLLKLQWGGNTTLEEFQGYLSQVDVKYTLFKPGGAPIRATVSLSFKELPEEGKKQNPTSGSLVNGRSHVVTAGESLPSLAYGEYGDPTLWRALAVRNGIDDPLRLVPGTTLVIPHATDVSRIA